MVQTHTSSLCTRTVMACHCTYKPVIMRRPYWFGTGICYGAWLPGLLITIPLCLLHSMPELHSSLKQFSPKRARASYLSIMISDVSLFEFP